MAAAAVAQQPSAKPGLASPGDATSADLDSAVVDGAIDAYAGAGKAYIERELPHLTCRGHSWTGRISC